MKSPNAITSSRVVCFRMPKAWVKQATRRSVTSPLDRAVEEGCIKALRRALHYGCRREKLGQYGDLFLELSPNDRTMAFLRSHPPHSILAAWARSVAGAWGARGQACTPTFPTRRVHTARMQARMQARMLSRTNARTSERCCTAVPLRLSPRCLDGKRGVYSQESRQRADTRRAHRLRLQAGS